MKSAIKVVFATLLLTSCVQPEHNQTVEPSTKLPAPTIVTSSGPNATKPVLITSTHSIADNREKAEIAIQEHLKLEEKTASMKATGVIEPPVQTVTPIPTAVAIASESTTVPPIDSNTDNFIMIVSREIIYAGKPFPAYPTNLILFPHKPSTVTELSNYQFICEIWQANFPKTEEVRKRYKPDEVTTIPMYWIASSKIKGDTCSEYVKNYDYARAQTLSAKFHLDPNKVQILSILKSGTIVMDMTSLNRQAQIELAMSTWRRKMCFSPKDDTKIYVFNLYNSTKESLGVLGALLAMR